MHLLKHPVAKSTELIIFVIVSFAKWYYISNVQCLNNFLVPYVSQSFLHYYYYYNSNKSKEFNYMQFTYHSLIPVGIVYCLQQSLVLVNLTLAKRALTVHLAIHTVSTVSTGG